MLASLALLVVTGQPINLFAGDFSVVEPIRLQCTPVLDGRIDPEEWDPLATQGTFKSYLQWERKTLHVAAVTSPGHDLIISIDPETNGWLVGKDNIEIRVKANSGKPIVVARGLDATLAEGPQWIDQSGYEVTTKAALGTTDDDQLVYEVTIVDPGVGFLEDFDSEKIAIRVDQVPGVTAQSEPYLPRNCAAVSLARHRASALPADLKFKPEVSGRVVMPGDPTRIRLTFNGTNAIGLSKISLASEGFTRDQMNKLEAPFPEFDSKGRAFVDLDTRVSREALLGHRILRAVLTPKEGPPAVLQTSFEVASILEFDLVRQKRTSKPGSQILKIPIWMKSNSTQGVVGRFNAVPPPRFEILKGNESNFTIATSRGRVRRVFDLLVPPSAQGTFPMVLTAEVGDRKVEQTIFFRID